MGIGTKYGITAETGNNIQTLGLVAYWDAAYKKSYTTGSLPPSTFNIASGSLTPTGSLKNDIGFSNDNQGSWVLDGTDDYVDISSINLGTACTVSAWCKITAFDTSKNILLGGGSSNYIFYPRTTTLFYCAIDGSWEVETISALSTGTWYNFVLVRNGANGELFINESSEANYTALGTSDLILNYIGKENTGYFWNGNVANIQFYNRALTSGDILQNYNAQKDRFGY